jgi:hypothetical protein
MEARLPLARRTELACRHIALTAPRQLDLVLDDVRLLAMTPAERQAVLTPRDSRAMDVIGIICSSCADWWKPASSTSMAFRTRADRTTAYCSA